MPRPRAWAITSAPAPSQPNRAAASDPTPGLGRCVNARRAWRNKAHGDALGAVGHDAALRRQPPKRGGGISAPPPRFGGLVCGPFAFPRFAEPYRGLYSSAAPLRGLGRMWAEIRTLPLRLRSGQALGHPMRAFQAPEKTVLPAVPARTQYCSARLLRKDRARRLGCCGGVRRRRSVSCVRSWPGEDREWPRPRAG